MADKDYDISVKPGSIDGMQVSTGLRNIRDDDEGHESADQYDEFKSLRARSLGERWADREDYHNDTRC